MESALVPVTPDQLMTAFAERTGLADAEGLPRRYLWTDAFALCNFIDLFRSTGNRTYLDLALRLVDQVHRILGRHRPDDSRTGWISGLDEEEGARHPTAGGLRIGKQLPERTPDEPLDDRLEWDRDGQYYHYLTKWMHALLAVWRVTGDEKYLRWSVELAKGIHPKFTSRGFRGVRMYWKMSIDLSRPLVPSMGQHDPLDGLITFSDLQAAAEGRSIADLRPEIEELAEMARGIRVETDDPLGIGGLLFDAGRIVRLTISSILEYHGLLEEVLQGALVGLAAIARSDLLRVPISYRLAFRELGLAIGLHGVTSMREAVAGHPELFAPAVSKRLEALLQYVPLRQAVTRFWSDPVRREAEAWREHEDINAVMLATSLAPATFLTI